MKKKIGLFLLATAMSVSALAGCGKNDGMGNETTSMYETAPETSSQNDAMQDTSTNGANNTEDDMNNIHQEGSVTTTETSSEGMIEEIATDVKDGVENIGEDINQNVNDVTRGR